MRRFLISLPVCWLPCWLLLAGPHWPTGSINSIHSSKMVVATVVVFLDTECPICQQYTRPLAALYGKYAAKGVRFDAIYPSATDTKTAISVFNKTYNLPFAGQPDPVRMRVRQYKATVTPEVVVLDARGVIVYQGAIDNWFVALGRYRPEATQNYLRDALDALLDNRPVTITRTGPVGCRIQ